MTVTQLHELTGKIVADGDGANEVAIDFATFSESDSGTILTVESADERTVQGADDSGPTGAEFRMLVLGGGFIP